MVVPGCGDAPGPTRTAEPAAPRARSEAEAPALPDCWEGEVHVEERLHPGPPEPGCEPAGEIVWKGTALVRVRRGDRESRGWLIPHSPLHYERIDYEITQTGFEQRCIRPDPAPGLSGRSSREVRRIVQDASHRGVLEGARRRRPRASSTTARHHPSRRAAGRCPSRFPRPTRSCPASTSSASPRHAGTSRPRASASTAAPGSPHRTWCGAPSAIRCSDSSSPAARAPTTPAGAPTRDARSTPRAPCPAGRSARSPRRAGSARSSPHAGTCVRWRARPRRGTVGGRMRSGRSTTWTWDVDHWPTWPACGTSSGTACLRGTAREATPTRSRSAPARRPRSGRSAVPAA